MLLRSLQAEAAVFERAKRFTIIGATLAFLLWFTGSMAVGSELPIYQFSVMMG
jgi:predicted small integral membrane protein